MPYNLLDPNTIIGMGQLPDIAGSNRNALSAQIEALRLRQANQQMLSRNQLAQVFQQPGAIDPSTGAVPPEVLQQVMGIDPASGMDMLDRQLLAQDRQARSRQREQEESQARQAHVKSLIASAVRYYYQQLDAGASVESALRGAKEIAQAELDNAWRGGSTTEAGFSREDYLRGKSQVDAMTPETMDQLRAVVIPPDEQERGRIADIKAQSERANYEHQLVLERQAEQRLLKEGGGISISGYDEAGRPLISIGGAGGQAKPSVAEQAKLRETEAGLREFEGNIDALDDFIAEKGTEVSVGPWNATDARRGQSLYSNVIAGLRVLYNTGVLQPGEWPMLEMAIANPTSWQNVGQANAIRGQIQVMRAALARKQGLLEEQKSAAGMPPTQGASPRAGGRIKFGEWK